MESAPITAHDLARHAGQGPRYTSYPPATAFAPGFGADQAQAALARLGASRAPISLYCHIPFCSTLCWYCACNVKVTRNRDRGRAYVDRLIAELTLVSQALGGSQPVVEIALGGGSPNFLEPVQHSRLIEAVVAAFDLRDDAALGIELDPRDTSPEQVDNLAALGFNRLSVGVQDFDQEVQDAIHRQQSVDQTRELIAHARRRGFTSVNVDLVYGLPGQTQETLLTTLAAVIEMAPQQVAIFGYAHLPQRFRHQKLVERRHPVPGLDRRAELLLAAQEAFAAAGYVRVGIDHFAHPDAPLARAARDGTLQRNFQGYCVRRADDLIGCGASAISAAAGAYWQNAPGPDAWAQAVAGGRLPVVRGIELSRDDIIRRDVITQLMCWAELDFAAIEGRHDIRFEDYFGAELDRLDGDDYADLVELDRRGRRLGTTRLGFDLVRNVCMVFDSHLTEVGRARFSPTL
ncbi:oxygen-independent coproporphyrinogen III oxidase [Haliangium sp.]|uniref:oxygen-independent coproporphyrinogen III oxidase n=1 Tax=Haliangium sp. TaxID=2663208 RepID=UPI003D0BF5B8